MYWFKLRDNGVKSSLNNFGPCVFTKLKNDEFYILCIYVDDGIITGSQRIMKNTIYGLKKLFKVKLEMSIKDFLNC
jgi:hypothetical protein